MTTPAIKYDWEYVMSGTSYTRITYPSIRDFPEEAKKLHSYFLTADKIDDHRFSLLYNAYAEPNFPIAFSNFRECYYKTHADSGGLQLITQGAKIDAATKRKIYTNQAKWSDIAMSFDEIPLITVGGKSGRGSLSTRFWDNDGYREKAKLSGENLAEQIVMFRELKTEAKPMLIIQGNTFENAIEWADIILEIVPADDHQYIGGIAMGGGTFGMGEKEMVLRTVVAAEVLRRNKHIKQYVHFLGIGSIRMFFAAIYLRRNGWLKDVEISYDSTSHSSAPHMGRHVAEGARNLMFTRTLNQDYEIILDDIKKRYPSFPYTLQEFHRNMTTSASKMTEADGNHFPVVESFVASIMTCVRNFQAELYRVDQDPARYLEAYVEPQNWGKYDLFKDVSDANSYKKWDREFGNTIKSKKITAMATSLMDFF